MALEFVSASSEYITIDDVSNEIKGLTEGAVMYWINYSTAAGSIFSVGDSDASSFYIFGLNNSKLGLRYQKAGVDVIKANIAASLTTGIWNHFIFAIDSGGNKVYINGVLTTLIYENGDASTTAFFSDNIANWDNVETGRRNSNSSPSGYLNGKSYDIRIYNRVPLVAEAKVIFESKGNDGITNGLKGRWLLNEKSNGETASGADQVVDISGDNRHGTAINTPTYRPAPLKLVR